MTKIIHVVTDTKKIKREVNSNSEELFVWKLGSEDRPASAKDIKNFQDCLSKCFKSDMKINHIITHHAVDCKRYNFKPSKKK